VSRGRELVVAGAGMAGLVAAARARELGASVIVREKGDRPGGSALLSSGFVWRYREWDTFRVECPGGDPALQRLVWERLDDALGWLEALGAPVRARDTGNPLTTGLGFEPAGLVEALVRRAGEVRLGEPLERLPAGNPVVLATGGFQADRELVRRHVTPEADALLLRSNPWSAGDGLRLGLEAGATQSVGLDEFYGRNMAAVARLPESKFVEWGQLYASFATVVNERGETYETHTWSEVDVAQWTARQPGARAWYRVPRAALGERVRDRTVGEMIEAAHDAGAAVEEQDGEVVVPVRAGITTTLGGLRIDERGRAADGLFAAGADAGGISTGGWSSGLASALVLGLIAAESAVG
jgi:succinate dehydrogenase/fumarate reductase flavoprotein subunit